MEFVRIGIVGAGTMGHGIAHVSALAGYSVVLQDVDDGRVSAGVAKVRANMDKGVEKGKLSSEDRNAAMARLSTTTTLGGLAGCDLIIEAIPE